MTTDRWNAAFLDSLRLEGDARADEALRLMLRDGESFRVDSLFRVMDANDEVPPSKTFPVLSEFFASTDAIPPEVDFEKIRRGEDVFREHAYAGALALLNKSLPEGYQAPNLSIILNISGDLRAHTYRRLLSTLQTVVNVSSSRGFTRGGRAVITAQKLRLLHAGVRHLALKARPDYRARYGVPVNQEDMLGTIMGFSLLVIEGWRLLEVGLTHQQEEDFLYLWLVFARMMGLHPPGQPNSTEYIPRDIDDATAFYRTYERRHYVDGNGNPDGVALAGAMQSMLRRLIPAPLRWIGFGVLPGICLTEMMGTESCVRLGIFPIPGHALLKWTLVHAHKLLNIFEEGNPPDHERLGMIFFRSLIDRSYGGEVTFTVPMRERQLKAMVDSGSARSDRRPHLSPSHVP